jgi:hypothetical protein
LQLARIDGTVLGPTDEAQAGARVVLLDSLGSPVAETTTAADGHFSFPAIAFGTYVIRAGAASMETVAVPVTVERALPIHADVRLRPAISDTVLVRGSAEIPSVTSRLSLAGESLHGTPARSRPRALQDAVSSAPGWGSEDNGLLHVRGVDDGVLYVVDGVPVYERFDALSGIGPDLATLSSVNVMTGYIPPEFGLKSGAVIEVRSMSGRREWTGSVDVGYGSDTAWNGGGLVGGPLGSRVSMLIGATGYRSRRFLDPVHPENLHNDGDAARGDAQLTWDPGARDLISASIGGGRSAFQVPHGEVQEIAGQDQRQELTYATFGGSWQRTWSNTTVSHLAAVHRSTTGALDGSPRDIPLFAAANRRHVRTGLLASVTHQRGAHVLKAGTELSRMGLRESFIFSVTDPDVAIDAGLSERTLQFGGDNPFAFTDSATPMLWSFYVQDSLRPLPRMSLEVGVRFDRTTLLVPAHQWSPRLGAAITVAADTIVRASFGRFFQPPQPEYLLLSSSVQARELSPFRSDDEAGGADVEPERQTALEAGIERTIGASARVSATGWLRRVRNAADPNVFFGTTIIFPNSVARGRARGLDLRLELQRRRGWSGYLSYALARVIQTGPITGGLFLEDVADIGAGVEFVPDHDQRHAVASGITYEHAPTGISLSLTGRYQGGTPIQREDGEDLTERPGVEMVDLATGRVKPRTTIDLAVAAPVARTNAVSVMLRGAVLNLFDARYAFNFGNPFSGTHFGAPRTAGISLAFEFK